MVAMTAMISRRDLLHIGCGTAAATFGLSAAACNFGQEASVAQTETVSNASKEEKALTNASGVGLFYRDDWLGDPWRKPDPALLIHAAGESSFVWFGWVPRMATEVRLIRPDLPGFGQSKATPGFEWALANLATVVARLLDTVGVDSVHIIGAEFGGSVAMQFAADYPRRTRTLAVVGSPAGRIGSSASSAPQNTIANQRDRLGSAASKEQVEYWDKMVAGGNPEGKAGASKVLSTLNLENALPRITAPTLVITSDRSKTQSVEVVTSYQQKIPNSRLLVIRSDADHVAAVHADECVTNILSFIKEAGRKV
jgi:pimeloyl-ACP methyl ester carboxylesterase